MRNIRNRLHVRQAQRVAGVALLLGLLFSTIEIAIDFRSERSAIHSTVDQVLRSLQTPAAQAAFTLSKYQADGVTDSLLKYELIRSAAVTTETGVLLSRQSHDRGADQQTWLSERFAQGAGEFSLPLYAHAGGKVIGNVVVTIDATPVANNFLRRAGLTLLFGFLTSMALALAVSVVFYYTLSRPLRRLSRALAMAGTQSAGVNLSLNPADYHDSELGDLLASANRFLEHQVEVRTQALQTQNAALKQAEQNLQASNHELLTTLATLSRAQDELVHSEKLAALGALVAGVAHELNTPIGNSLTVASTLEYHTQTIATIFASSAGLKRSTLEAYFSDVGHAVDIMLRSLHRAADLILSFKQVAVDQTSSQRRGFDLAELVSEIIKTLSPTLKKTAFTVQQNVPRNLRMDSYPGPLGQVLMNLVNNAIIHGFDGRTSGNIVVDADAAANGMVALRVSDDGKGIAPEHLKRIYDPFFTTRLGSGGSGLGLNIAHNIVEGVLGGHIAVRSDVGGGTTFTLTLPLVAPQAPAA